MENNNLKSITGYIENILFKNEETGFGVVEIVFDNILLVVVGNISSLNEGEDATFYGEFIAHQKYGQQFKASAFEVRMPETKKAILKYLSSGVIKGIGISTARKIVELFGEETFNIIENSPDSLLKIKGISPTKLNTIVYEYNKICGIKKIVLFLSKYNITTIKSIKVWKIFGNQGISFIKTNPFILTDADIDIDFETADSIAEDMDIQKNNSNRISSALKFILSYNKKNGHTSLPKETLISLAISLLNISESDISPIIDIEIQKGKFIELFKNRSYIYISEIFEEEINICERIKLLLSKNISFKKVYSDIEIKQLISSIEEENNIFYEDIQKKAIESALTENIMILTGGPGTGKTTTLNAIIKILETEGNKIILSAPTGRAAKVLSNVTDRDAKTIHRILEVGFNQFDKTIFVKNENNQLKCDVVIIDEMSMVDTFLFSSFIKALPEYCKIIIVGDYDQLPSVGAGNIIKDLIDSQTVPTICLKEIFRQAKSSLIIKNAHLIINGENPILDKKDSDFFFIEQNNGEKISKTIIDLISYRLAKKYGFSPIKDIQILCPSKKSTVGTTSLNKDIQAVINPPSKEKSEVKYNDNIFRVGDKVMQIKNNYNIPWEKDEKKGLGVFNGDIGIILSLSKKDDKIIINFEGKIATYNYDSLSEIVLGYAITIHKSQGSEFKSVIIPILEGYDKLYYRSLLYTGVTRAKQILILIGSAERIRFMINNNKKMFRYTGLKFLLQGDD